MGDLISPASGRALQKRSTAPGALTKAKRKRFLDTLAATCNVKASAAAADVSVSGCYNLRHRDPAFAEMWREAMLMGYERLEEALLSKALTDVDAIDLQPDAGALVIVDVVGDAARAGLPSPRDPHGNSPAKLTRRAGTMDVQLALAMLGRQRPDGAAQRGRQKPGKLATQQEVVEAINAKLDGLARRFDRA